MSPLAAYKGFGLDWTCRGHQFEIGQTYRITGRIVRCGHGFHACAHPFHVWDYYPPGTSRFAVVEQGGATDRETGGDTKIASAEITIKAEIRLPELIRRGVEWIIGQAKGNTATGDRGRATATGDSGHAAATGDRGRATATGDSGHAAATGDRGHAAATGYRGHAAATGDRGHAAATGDRGHAAATGDRGHAAATGDRGHAAATGDRGHAAATGDSGIAAALGPNSTAKAGANGWLVLAVWKCTADKYELLQVRTAKVGGPEGVLADVVYRLTEAGAFEIVG